ncbi:putative DNA-binding domain-containing protein [Alteromonas sp. 5E99-2]|uniref:HvfC/BufC N-terminal domain-containing protein n=1 Tax=Alteromonas sp. 5E99-2 TaxID=2817683 RepID=UPI001A98509B|nr:DNA-binding domain-containing protein [Alteromonas sp. 5E99-2]MBO1254690.1 putative DNA-binding domain-containing protein [Alteromonas sp. 5E99-2]
MADYFSALASYVKDGNSEVMRPFLSSDEDEHKLAIFRNTFLSSCVDTLKRRFQSCVSALGEEYFHYVARQYVDHNTPSSKVLADYGNDMPTFLLNMLKEQNLDYVSDLAKLDNTWNQVYFAKSSTAPSESDLARWMENIDEVSLGLASSASLVVTEWSVSSVWSELKEGELTQQHAINPEKEFILMWRDANGIILHRSLLAGEYEFIYSIHSGKPLTEAAEAASQHEEIDISAIFSQLITNNLLTEKV